ncbi:hypothetical protein BDV96DRAFT_601183 [Lophiotrema nucula]|uniref:Uncharacterized protein n=1 Tax=Lophiotrema nucula TaxID=690887 RepID=A0A6A5Z2P7_9PLEO|nr:hypothetical protein BDV96DRAFT_601183 [Lophiotrema nucula]
MCFPTACQCLQPNAQQDLKWSHCLQSLDATSSSNLDISGTLLDNPQDWLFPFDGSLDLTSGAWLQDVNLLGYTPVSGTSQTAAPNEQSADEIADVQSISHEWNFDESEIMGSLEQPLTDANSEKDLAISALDGRLKDLEERFQQQMEEKLAYMDDQARHIRSYLEQFQAWSVEFRQSAELLAKEVKCSLESKTG